MALGPLSARDRQIAEHNHLPSHTHPFATTSAAGFLSAADKIRVDNTLRYDAAQALTGAQKDRAHSNLGLGALADWEPAGTSGTDKVLSGGGWIDGLTKWFESAPTAFVNENPVTVNHGLGGYPKLMQVLLQCAIAEGGYAVGERVEASNAELAKSCNQLSLSARVINLTLPQKTTGSFDITPANWRFVFIAAR